MCRLKLFLSFAFFTGYLGLQCALCVRSIASDVRLQYGFGMFTAKHTYMRPYGVVRSDGSEERFRMRRGRGSTDLQFVSEETDTVLSYNGAADPLWDVHLLCRAHSSDAVAIEWTEGAETKRFDCPD